MTTLASEVSVIKCHVEPDNESADDESGDICEPAAKNRKISPLTGSSSTRQ